MKTVLKFSFAVTDRIEVEMPRAATIVHVGVTRSRPSVWALVEESEPIVLRRFRLTATAEPIPDFLPEWKYVGHVAVGTNDCHLWDLGETAREG